MTCSKNWMIPSRLDIVEAPQAMDLLWHFLRVQPVRNCFVQNNSLSGTGYLEISGALAGGRCPGDRAICNGLVVPGSRRQSSLQWAGCTSEQTATVRRWLKAVWHQGDQRYVKGNLELEGNVDPTSLKVSSHKVWDLRFPCVVFRQWVRQTEDQRKFWKLQLWP